jgi:hypothetical protein
MKIRQHLWNSPNFFDNLMATVTEKYILSKLKRKMYSECRLWSSHSRGWEDV